MDNLIRCKRKFDLAGNYLRTSMLVAVLLLAGASASQAQVSFGINIGPPPRPRVIRVVPRSPGPDYSWIDGYWYPSGRHYKWHAGYYTRLPYAGARWVGPRYEGQQYYAGYWEGDRGRLEHDHHWDRNRNRDQDRYQGQDRGQNYDQGHNQDQDQRHDDNHR